MSAIPKLRPRSPDPDPSGDDIIAAMGGLGRNGRLYIELGNDFQCIAVYYEPNFEQEEQDVDGHERTVRGAWVTHRDKLRKPYSTLNEALIEALKEVEALI